MRKILTVLFAVAVMLCGCADGDTPDRPADISADITSPSDIVTEPATEEPEGTSAEAYTAEPQTDGSAETAAEEPEEKIQAHKIFAPEVTGDCALDIITSSDGGAVVSFTNSGDSAVTVGWSYSICAKIDGELYELILGAPVGESAVSNVPAGQTGTLIIDWSERLLPLPGGDYELYVYGDGGQVASDSFYVGMGPLTAESFDIIE